MENWEKSISLESDYWDRYSSEIHTVIQQERYLENLDIYKDYSGIHGKSSMDLDFKGKKVIDIGGGPCSILLRANGGKRRELNPTIESWGVDKSTTKTANGVVIDPVICSEYVKIRYNYFNIDFINDDAESLYKYYNEINYFDEAIIYNCLQHVMNPVEILDQVIKVSKKIRICEPINVPTDALHLHTFTSGYFEKYFSDNLFRPVKNEICEIGTPHYTGIYEKII